MKQLLFIMDLSASANTTGIDRYLESLLAGLAKIKSYDVVWLSLRSDPLLFMHRIEQKEGYRKLVIPIPEQASNIISEQYWSDQYYHVVVDIVSKYICVKQISIAHIHTLNLIYLALFLKKESGCKIITHLHCIPWKGMLDRDKAVFQLLYHKYYSMKDYTRKLYMTNISEENSYLLADKVICLTECAKVFVQNITQISRENIAVIPNGMDDRNNTGFQRIFPREGKRILFVGGLTESKGIFTIIQAMDRLYKQGNPFELIAAGRVDPNVRTLIKNKYSHLNIQLPGRVDFETLKEYYKWADIGCIASLHEQSSYVAIEMSMFGLPVIATAVDGLDEMFEDGINALKVRTLFHRHIGLHADISQMVEVLTRLSKSKSLRASLSLGIRQKYLSSFTLKQMIDRTIGVYQEVMR